MHRRSLLKIYLRACILSGFLCVGWFALNQLRVRYYDDAVEGHEDSPYWPVVHTQDILVWPIRLLAVFLFLAVIYEMGRWLVSKLSR
jgi:hypothetical protein